MDIPNTTIKKEVIKYEVSKDGVGLLGYFDDGSYYHIHSDELSQLEQWILKILNDSL